MVSSTGPIPPRWVRAWTMDTIWICCLSRRVPERQPLSRDSTVALHARKDTTLQTPTARARFEAEHRRIWNEAVGPRGFGAYYHQRLVEIYRFLVSPNKRVLEIGCASGDLLAAVAPSLRLRLYLFLKIL